MYSCVVMCVSTGVSSWLLMGSLSNRSCPHDHVMYDDCRVRAWVNDAGVPHRRQEAGSFHPVHLLASRRRVICRTVSILCSESQPCSPCASLYNPHTLVLRHCERYDATTSESADLSLLQCGLVCVSCVVCVYGCVCVCAGTTLPRHSLPCRRHHRPLKLQPSVTLSSL